MSSTFFGLETARRAINAQRIGLQTTSHNIANANTPGYSRQRVNLNATNAFPTAGMNQPSIPGQIGTGVEGGSIQRIRDQFLDVQFRSRASDAGFWHASYKSFERMEDIFNESFKTPEAESQSSNISRQLNQFWNAWSDLASGKESKSVLKEEANTIAESFNSVARDLVETRDQLKSEIDATQEEVNALLKAINQINIDIRSVEPHGYVPNDLYDRQDSLIDELSNLIDIKVERSPSGGQSSNVAEGAVSIKMVGMDEPLVSYNDPNAVASVEVGYSNSEFGEVSSIIVNRADGSSESILASDFAKGEFKGLIQAFGYQSDSDDPSSVEGSYVWALEQVKEVAQAFAREVNAVHSIGFTEPDVTGQMNPGGEFFTFTDNEVPFTLAVNNDILTNTNNIASLGVNLDALEDKSAYQDLLKESPINYLAIQAFLADDGNFKDGMPKAITGNHTNAQLISEIRDTKVSFNGGEKQIGTFYRDFIGEMGAKGKQAAQNYVNSDMLLFTIDGRRQQISNVSMDEELTMMIQFQHAYNAAARSITVADEMLDRIINGMGVVGR
ncbi:flagellar hook-associated protein FlgK [Alkalicoccobacillus murimartini]|uniref:Flagellar hook-associated protein 1 n=1 Tax=Alkalicoccobacillus murimartini TaxID=171685 RepID=A0ABT9YFY1_9BACI|nr:flagellar hook-associated protein FlgK [Alkalicoccobacillus murimartini]MDQ0206766.1 flagellar hook-associated protein 1 FlgK [Alkalicoccobacillus murimartini]